MKISLRERLLARITRFSQKNMIRTGGALFIAVFAVGGVTLLLISRAATLTVANEPETGTISGTASVISDSGASGGQAVRFGSTQVLTPTMTATINGSTIYQTMDGFGVSINSHSWNNGELKPALDMLIDQNGSRIFRVVMEMTDWEATNDDADPNNYNWTYYNSIYSNQNFTNLWDTIDYLHQKGIPDSGIILSYMGIGPSWMGGVSVNSSMKDEWAEQAVSAAYYGYAHGHTFGIFSPNNEEDWGHNEGITMTTAIYADAMNRVAQRLDSLGMSSVKLIGPDTAQNCSAITYWNAMAAYPTLMSKVDHMTTHDYSGSTCNALGSLHGSAYPSRNLWMDEFSIFDQGWSLLDQGSSALLMWDAYDSVYQHAILNGLGSQPGNDAGNAPALIAYSATTHVYTPRKTMYQFGQLYKYVTSGMQMVDANTSNNIPIEAFVHPTTHALTIVGENNSGSNHVIGGTLTNTPQISVLHYSQTNSTSNMAAGTDVPVVNGSFKVSVPKGTTFTLTTLPL